MFLLFPKLCHNYQFLLTVVADKLHALYSYFIVLIIPSIHHTNAHNIGLTIQEMLM